MKKIVLGIVAVVILVVSAVFGLKGSNTENPVGAVSGPDISSPYLCVNGACTFYNKVAPVNATTTVCAIKSPSATSTLASYSGVSFRVSSTTNSVVTIARSATQYATTTIIATSSVALNAQASILAASTTPIADSAAGRLTLSDRIFAPNTYVVVGMEDATAEATAGSFSPTGSCRFDFVVLQ